ncbi:hypothetical protein KKG81_13275, partial [bacterium]|nr:hypothetical protein [bacterium]
IPFNLEDRDSCFQYLLKKWGHLRKDYKQKIAYTIYHVGGIKGVDRDKTFISYFPGYDNKGELLNPAKYGVLEYHENDTDIM